MLQYFTAITTKPSLLAFFKLNWLKKKKDKTRGNVFSCQAVNQKFELCTDK